MFNKKSSEMKQENEGTLWTFFDYQQPSVIDFKKTTRSKVKAVRPMRQDDIDLFTRPLIDMTLPQPKSQSVFYAQTKAKAKKSSKSRTNKRITRGKKA